jgi:hypothetical protein
MFKSIQELLKPSSIYAFMIYGTFCYLALKGQIASNIVENAFLILLSFYFGRSTANKEKENGVDNEKS